MSTTTDGGGTRHTVNGRLRRVVVLAVAISVAATGFVVGEFVSPAAAAEAKTIEVGPGDGLQLAVNGASAGDTIRLQTGVYTLSQPLVVSKKNDLSIVGVGRPDATILRYTGSNGRVVEVGSQRVTIEGVTITGGKLSKGNGAGILVSRNQSLTLVDSTVRGNSAIEGGGIENLGTLTVRGSTIVDNTATNKGGGIRNQGAASIENSTFVGNIASQGGALSSPGTTTVTHATMTANQSTSSSSAGIDRNGGVLQVYYSIIGGNVRTNGSPASDCSGTPELIGLNLVTDTSGCNPVGEVLVFPAAELGLGSLADNGGPTFTVGLLEGSPALNAVLIAPGGGCVSGIAVDQRGTVRPVDAGCDLGAYEEGRVDVDVSLSVDTLAYENRGYPAGVVEVGVISVPTGDITAELVGRDAPGTTRDSSLKRVALEPISLKRVTLEDVATQAEVELGDIADTSLKRVSLKRVSLKRVALDTVSLKRVALRELGLESISLKRVSLKRVALSDIPLLDIPGGWTELLAGTPFAGVPLQSISLEDLEEACTTDPNACVLDDRTLAAIDVTTSVLASLSVPALLLAGVAVGDLPVPEGSASWCEYFADQFDCSAEAGAADLLEGSELWEIQLAGGDVSGPELLSVALSELANPAPESTIRDASLKRVSLKRVAIENTALGAVSLKRVAGADGLTLLGEIVNCDDPRDPCSTDETNTLTLADVATDCVTQDPQLNPGPTPVPDGASCALLETATIGLLLDVLNQAGLLQGLDLLDLLLAFIASQDTPWEVIDLDAALLQNIGDPLQPSFDYIAEIRLADGPADLDVVLTLPAGFVAALAAGESATLCDAAGLCSPVPVVDRTALGAPSYRLPNVASGRYRLVVPARAGVVVGADLPAVVNVTATKGAQSDAASAGPVTVDVVAAGASGTGGGAPPVPILGDGQLRLGHIGSEGGVDLYSFTAPSGSTGASARVLLSNIAPGADYDLSVYGPRPTSLRGAPVRELSALGDIRYDLDPSTQVLATDVVADVVVDAPSRFGRNGQTLRDVSSKRSNNDEEVSIPALVEGTTYYVAVSSYLGASSVRPYGLRLRLDTSTALPACAAELPALPSAVGRVVPAGLEVNGNTNTLFVTSWERLAREGTVPEANSVLREIAETNQAGVVPGLVLVDDLLAFDAWEDRCDPDQRNAVVREIGGAIDVAIEAAGGDVDHLVIVGGDGVVPMAAVPDLTVYSNESTFARDVLTADFKSNEVAAALGSGYLLSDDPYATEAGISVLNGDHELYMPDRSIGRLVEKPWQIIQQLNNFQTYEGRIDATTLAAAVTGYDFLTDGANAVADGLGGALTTSPLISDEWDDAAFLALLAAPYDVISPNAHFDFESLLPAKADAAGYYTADQLVDASEVAALGLTTTVVFTMGCHAGLSISDVQLGFTSLDWAEMFAEGDNPFIGHTTYGYGDTEVVAYSERLAAIYAGYLADIVNDAPGAPATLGEALQRTKSDYLASTLLLTPYDEKVLQSFTYYGLPMYTIGEPETAPTNEVVTSTVQATEVAIEAASAPASPVTFGSPFGGGRVPVTIDLEIGARGPANLDLVETDEGEAYYTVGGNTVVAPYRPIQPLVDVAIPETGRGYQGFLITGLTTTEFDPFDVRYSTPIKDSSDIEGVVESQDASFPSTLQRVAGPLDGQRLLVAAGQFQAAGGAEVQRLFTNVTGELLPYMGPESPRDDVAPGFVRVESFKTESVAQTGKPGVRFEIDTDADAERVVVVFRETVGAVNGRQSIWRSAELARRASSGGVDSWFGSAALVSSDNEVEFFAQSVDAAGNVGVTSNKIENFLASEEDDGAEGLGFVYTGDPARQFDSFFASPAAFELQFNGVEAEEATFSIDSARSIDYNATRGVTVVHGAMPDDSGYEANGTVVVERGAHILFGELPTGERAYRFFILDPDGPSLTVTPERTVSNTSPVTVTVATDDGEGSGVASTTATACLVIGTTCQPLETPTIIDGMLTLSTEGLIRLTVTSTDRVGNATSKTVEVRIDTTAPTVNITQSPTPNAAGWVQSATITISVVESGSGVALVEYRLDDGPWSPYIAPFAAPSGITRIEGRAFDNAGNSGTDILDVRVDPDAPSPTDEVTLVLRNAQLQTASSFSQNEAATALFSCRDAISGIATCTIRAGLTASALATLATYTGTTTNRTVTLPTGVIGEYTVELTAVDNAGNITVVTATYTVTPAYAVCYLYDPYQAKSIGSNYTIKIQLCDPVTGANLSSRDISLTALTINGSIDPGPNFSGNSNSGYVFRWTQNDRSYTYNLNTTGLPPGTNTLYITTQPVPDRNDLPPAELGALFTLQ